MATRSTLSIQLSRDPGDPFELLIDGKPFRPPGTEKWEPFYPEGLLGEERPLLPADRERIGLLLCDCGEPGCGTLAALITIGPDVVTWTQFGNYCAAFLGPSDVHMFRSGSNEPDPRWWVDTPALTFDLDEYRAEVQRATQVMRDIIAEPTVSKTLDRLLRSSEERFRGTAYRYQGIFETGTDHAVVGLGPDDEPWETVKLRLQHDPDATIDDAAHQMFTSLWSVAPSAWASSFGGAG